MRPYSVATRVSLIQNSAFKIIYHFLSKLLFVIIKYYSYICNVNEKFNDNYPDFEVILPEKANDAT